MFIAEIRITLKEGVLDPQGTAVQKALHAMEYSEVRSVRIGKYMEISLEGTDRETAAAEVEEMCRRLLANPVIEEYTFEIREVER